MALKTIRMHLILDVLFACAIARTRRYMSHTKLHPHDLYVFDTYSAYSAAVKIPTTQ